MHHGSHGGAGYPLGKLERKDPLYAIPWVLMAMKSLTGPQQHIGILIINTAKYNFKTIL